MNTDCEHVSFEPPFHTLPVEHQAWIRYSDSTLEMDWIDFDQLHMTQMPDILVMNGKRFKYVGVSDGRGFYNEIENA